VLKREKESFIRTHTALYTSLSLSTFSHFLIVNKTSLSLSLFNTPLPPLPPPSLGTHNALYTSLSLANSSVPTLSLVSVSEPPRPCADTALDPPIWKIMIPNEALSLSLALSLSRSLSLPLTQHSE
jgi:hypothetical protein